VKLSSNSELSEQKRQGQPTKSQRTDEMKLIEKLCWWRLESEIGGVEEELHVLERQILLEIQQLNNATSS
jgi:hypothetical protein